MTSVSFSSVLACSAAQPVFTAGERGPLWRVISGEVRIDRVDGPVRQLMQLALPGDLIGIESLCDQAYQYSATALTPARLAPVRVTGPADHERWLRQALMQQHMRCQDMAALRTGQVPQRLAHLLQLLGHAWQQAQGEDLESRALSDRIREALPALREVADVVDAKHETVCRVLARLLPPRRRQSRSGGSHADQVEGRLVDVRQVASNAAWPMTSALAA